MKERKCGCLPLECTPHYYTIKCATGLAPKSLDRGNSWPLAINLGTMDTFR